MPEQSQVEPCENFAEMLAQHEVGKNSLQAGQKVKGKIITITNDSVFVDLGVKQDGVMDRAELLDANGEMIAGQGDEVEAWIIGLSPQGARLSRSMSGSGVAPLEEARDSGIPVDARVIGPCKGGYQIQVMGKVAFCPGSQMEAHAENEDLTGRQMQVLITKVENHGRNIVVSRRALIERERQENLDKLLAKVKIGDVIDGTVTRLAPYGAFVELAPGIEGLAHISEMGWSRIEKPDEIAAPGDKVRVKIIGMEQDKKGNQRINLSIKQAEGDPWDKVTEKFAIGDTLTGKVRRLVPFGAFIEIAPGIEGLVHISEFSWAKRINKPEDLLAPDDEVSVRIKEINPEARRISLSIKDAQGDPWETILQKYAVGQKVDGKVESIGQFGVFINLEPGITGLLPAGVIRNAPSSREILALHSGDDISVVIRTIDMENRKLAFSPAGEESAEEDKTWRNHVKEENKKEEPGIMALALQKALRNKSRENA